MIVLQQSTAHFTLSMFNASLYSSYQVQVEALLQQPLAGATPYEKMAEL